MRCGCWKEWIEWHVSGASIVKICKLADFVHAITSLRCALMWRSAFCRIGACGDGGASKSPDRSAGYATAEALYVSRLVQQVKHEDVRPGGRCDKPSDMRLPLPRAVLSRVSTRSRAILWSTLGSHYCFIACMVLEHLPTCCHNPCCRPRVALTAREARDAGSCLVRALLADGEQGNLAAWSI